MNNFFKTIAFFTVGLLIVSCNNNDDDSEPLRDYSEQYEKDMAKIEEFLDTHTMTVEDNPGATNDQDVTFTKIEAGGTETSIMDMGILKTMYVNQNDITYKIYYIPLRGEIDRNTSPAADIEKAPCNVDRVLTSYVGNYLYTAKETQTINGQETEVDVLKFFEFERSEDAQSYLTLSSLIKGWSEILPKFKTGSYVGNPDGTVSYFDFGAGVMFIPSGLGYYNGGSTAVPGYSPLIFSFKLYEIQRVDNDGDGIDSYQEDVVSSIVNSDGTLTEVDGVADGYVRVFAEGVDNPDDTDGDGTPDFIDIDDDGDSFMTKTEIKDPVTGDAYPYANIPLCSDNKKKHLTAVCH
ncbi:FKBP-type peptidyl-prolyl cis-trans isomerase [Flavobacterium terrisoli]|uniref:FKBP-type peptidyl-prolyl cis-trans isomerase n=1 Tax=Flavobacterium terrisoli TaxID=3242195 RepID=UPI0025437329|nr:FKBP-type peptidylprolyl isomerase [Flavobacterium buctense]